MSDGSDGTLAGDIAASLGRYHEAEGLIRDAVNKGDLGAVPKLEDQAVAALLEIDEMMNDSPMRDLERNAKRLYKATLRDCRISDGLLKSIEGLRWRWIGSDDPFLSIAVAERAETLAELRRHTGVARQDGVDSPKRASPGLAR